MVGGSERATPAGVYSVLPAATFAQAITLAKAGKSSSSKYGGILRS